MKRTRLPRLSLIAAMLLSSPFAWGQPGAAHADTTGRIAYARLEISVDGDSARVFLNARPLGMTPCIADSLQPGLYHVRIESNDRTNWLTPVVMDSVRLDPGDHKSFRYSMHGGITIRSLPDGASVFLGDSLLGITPLVLLPGHWSPSSLLTLRKNGYDQAFISANQAIRTILTVPLQKQWNPGSANDAPFIDGSEDGRRSLRLYISGGIAVLAGAASAYFKIAADGRQEAYLAGGDPALLSERKRLDTGAGITFAVTQVSLALFCYFLLNE